MNAQPLSIDLADTASSDVYFVTPDDVDTLAAAATAGDFNLHRIDLGGCNDKAMLTQRLAEGLSLPESFGRDWDALTGNLRELGWLPSRGHVLLFTHAVDLRDADAAVFGELLDMLDESAANWAEEGVAFFAFLALPEGTSGDADEA